MRTLGWVGTFAQVSNIEQQLRPRRSLAALTPLRMPLTHSFDQRLLARREP